MTVLHIIKQLVYFIILKISKYGSVFKEHDAITIRLSNSNIESYPCILTKDTSHNLMLSGLVRICFTRIFT